jgi:hypothetical protein
VRPVRHVAVDLDAAVHRAGVEDDDVARRALQPLARDAEDAVVLAQRGDVAGLHALELQAQHVERLRPLDRRLDAVEHRHAERVDRVGQQRARAAHAHLGAHRPQPVDVAPRHARVQHVADHAHPPPLERPAELLAQREQVEQALRRVLVRAVAGVDHVALDALGEEPRRAGRAVADDDHVDLHGLEVPRRVDQRLALRHARPRARDAHRVGAHALLGELERDARARARLEEQVDDRLPAERRDLLDRPLAHLAERQRGVEHELELVAAEPLERQQVLAERRGARRRVRRRRRRGAGAGPRGRATRRRRQAPPRRARRAR